MISRICGKVVETGKNYLLIDVNGLTYEVLLPQAVMQRIEEAVGSDGKVTLKTFHYHQVEPSKSTPVLIGFLNDIERDFFQTFITVSGIGPRAALKALNKPISRIAQAIDSADTVFLKSLPGIGEQRAREIVAKLQSKVGRFGLIRDAHATSQGEAAKDISEEALAVLLQLQYKRQEAQEMLKKALENSPQVTTTEELLNEVYKQRKVR
jgi:Holliday junction DNA helicase RuvA